MTTLIIPFISICILSLLVDRFTLFLQEIMKKISWLPNKFDITIAYLLVFICGFIVCWRGNFDFFISLNFSFKHNYEGWLMTSLLLSGGSKFIRSSFTMMNSIPQVISNVYSSVGSLLDSTTNQTEEINTESEQGLP